MEIYKLFNVGVWELGVFWGEVLERGGGGGGSRSFWRGGKFLAHAENRTVIRQTPSP